MSKNNLVIVESPAKAKTIEKFLGAGYTVRSSFGHIRDLPKKGMSIDIENNFTPSYEVSPEKKKVIAELRKLSKTAELVWLASDKDREGEAIAWHLSEALKLDPKRTRRIIFSEITKPAVTAAIAHPRSIDIELVNAQQARRILDRLVGYELSPVLWKKVRPGLSAGRVQSVAVRLIVERENVIKTHTPQSSFALSAVFRLSDTTELIATSPLKYTTEAEAHQALQQLASSSFTIDSVAKTPGTRSPGKPFTTSTLQQTASSRLGYSPRQTMMLAQRLYEAGHITYMRTDSLNLSPIAAEQIASYIKSTHGENYLQARTFKATSAGAQEAHEAIRPTVAARDIAGDDAQQQKLYQLIWRRTIASQMAPAQVEKTVIAVVASASDVRFEAMGEIVLFDGFLKVEPSRSKEAPLLPQVKKGDSLKLASAMAQQSLSRAAARYTEASLVRKLEAMGIGRPSTYAPTIGTIQDRGYAEKTDVEGVETPLTTLKLQKSAVTKEVISSRYGADKNKLLPTDTGKVVTDFLVKHFPGVVDYDFTKDVEAEFDHIAAGKLNWHDMIAKFYTGFHKTIEASSTVTRAEATQSRTIGSDPKSGKPVIARYGRFGPMVQIGEAEDDNKPRFAGIPSSMGVEDITLEQALKLFNLPRQLGTTEQGEDVSVNTGRFGPYLKVGERNISIKDHDPYEIDLAGALGAIAEHAKVQAERNIAVFPSGISVLKGRFGPYITDGSKNAKIPKTLAPEDITEEKAKELLEAAPAKSAYRRRKK